MNKSSSNFLRYDISDINDPLLSEQLKQINETEERRCRCLEVLRRDLKNLKDIEPCLEEDFLLRFLRVSKFDTSKALQRVLKYYQNFEIYLDVYKKMSFPLHDAECIKHLKLGPYRCRDNSFLVFAKPAIDYKKFTFAQRFYLEVLSLHQVIENPVNQVCGGTYIIDHEGMDIHGFLAFTPFWVRLFVDSLVFTLPCRVKALHFVNTPSFYPLILKLVFPFLPKKIQNRIFIHAKNDNWSKLHALISPDILLEQYGGKLKPEDLIDCMHNLKEQEEKVFRLFAFGYIKTKSARQSIKVLTW
ncbi:unnamed protein product [Larinioides sclopetarius]|uniref:CRAL-TRIO domain-containing protein n=1 Tax=Larinioides sclopetarius TaxID=280406 RepID=A0AAV1ZAQ3_9ARAC